MQRRTSGQRSTHPLAFATTGLTLALTLVMVLFPMGGAVAPLKVYAAPYKGTVNSPNGNGGFGGCAKWKLNAPAWHALTGGITTSMSTSAKTCAKSLGSVGAFSFSFSTGGIDVAFPFLVGSNGNHWVRSSWTVNIASSWSSSAGPVCNKNINYKPTIYTNSISYCTAGTTVQFEVYGSVQDLSNSSWYNSNYSYVAATNQSFFQNYTDCYNYNGTPSCYNATNGSYAYLRGYNAAGTSAFTWNGATTLTLWNNGTNMVRGHHYVLTLSIYASAQAYAQFANLRSPWVGNALATINLGTLGNGVNINSITVV